MYKTVILLISTLLLTGCIRPLPVDEPNIKNYSKASSLSKLKDNIVFNLGLPPVTSIGEAKNALKIYASHYMSNADELRMHEYNVNDVGFLGTLTAIGGGAFKATDVAIGGATVAAGSTIFLDRYKLKVQAKNYENASDAMYCMYVRLYEHDNSWNYKLKSEINHNINSIRRKLRNAQSKVELTTPDTTKLKEALGIQSEVTKNNNRIIFNNSDRIKYLIGKLKECEALF